MVALDHALIGRQRDRTGVLNDLVELGDGLLNAVVTHCLTSSLFFGSEPRFELRDDRLRQKIRQGDVVMGKLLDNGGAQVHILVLRCEEHRIQLGVELAG